ncbi:N-acetylglucosamine kinase [Prauserella cavernicola]|uniref:N-acetylglucosamine kinase n=1 Tax=Prauserella cavernicola TaxID=2800127 RepID=A0A934V524_9PSEU|nr:BadF/BadG/BcrA/BcrD ATPase family protein [Prauserella cavernicola]MBK1785319.1 N-acetylglucosamine kinase [Prauserella cavernicola]
MSHVVGVDAGGTATRALALDADGAVLGTGRAGGANPNSHPPEQAAGAIADAVGAALAGLGGPSAIVIGMAGTSKLSDPAVATVFEQAWQRAGFGVAPRVVSDAETAFASATAEPDGTVLIAGTGSIAGRIRKRRMVSVAGGYGWLLGDEGSGFWLGREAVRATLDVLTRGGEHGPLVDAVLAATGVDAGEPKAYHRLITAANAERPVRLARFAPLVSETAGRDPVAAAIVERAAVLLTELALAAREPGERTPVVLVGSVLGEQSPVGISVRKGLAHLDVLASDDGVFGAAWLAAVDAFGEDAPRPNRVP